jgi:Tol biopolymer transport system component
MFLVVLASSSVSFSQDGWTPELGMKVRNVGSVRVSPDGRKVVYTVSQAVMAADKSEYVTQIWTANSDGSDPLQLTFADKSSDNPQWSPDGRMIAFTSSRSGKGNLYVLRLIGGEAEMVTDVKTSVGSFAWSPNGRQIALVMRDAQTDDEENGAKGKDDSRWVDENVKMNRLYVMNLDKDANGKREPRKLTW